MTRPAIPNSAHATARQRALLLTALAVTATAFMLVWSRGSSAPRHATPADSLHRVASGRDAEDSSAQRVLWSGEGIEIHRLQFSPDDKYLVAVLYNSAAQSLADRLTRRVIVVDSGSGKTVLDATELQPVAIAFADGSRSVAVLSRDMFKHRFILKVREIDSTAVKFETETRTGGVDPWAQSIGTLPGRRILAVRTWEDASGNDETYSAWDLATGEAVAFIPGNYTWSGGWVSPNGELIAHGGWPGPGIRISRASLNESGRRAVSFCMPEDKKHSRDRRHQWPGTSTFSPDSTRFLVAYEDGSLVDWKIIDGAEAQPTQIGDAGAFENCTSIALSQAGDRLAYAMSDGTIRIMGQLGK